MKLEVKESRDRLLALLLLTLSGLLIVSVLANCITGSLAWYCYWHQRTITTPMVYDRPFSSTMDGGDDNLYSMLARSLISLRLSVTPETVDRQHARLLSWVPPEERSALKKALVIEASYIKKNGISSVYSIEHEATDPKTGDIIVGGTIHASTMNGTVALNQPGSVRTATANGVSRTDLPDEKKAYRLHIQYDNGLIRLTAFPEVAWPAIFNNDDSGTKP